MTADPTRPAAAASRASTTPAPTATAPAADVPGADVPAVVQATGVGKVFGTDRAAVTALEAVDLTIRQGEFVSLIGPSGCGKSTLLRLIADLTAPTSGTILVNGKPPGRARQDRDYGMVFQAPVLMDWRTIAKNIELPLEIMGFSGRRAATPLDRPASARRARGLRRTPSLGAVGRDAAARRDRPGALLRSEAAADGRAVRRPRRDDPRADERRADEHLATDRHDDRVRHAQHPGGDLPVDAGRRDVGAARPDLAA